MSEMQSVLAAYNVPTTTKFGLDSFKKGWHCESGTNAGDQAMCVKVEKVLYQGRSKYQDVLVFESNKWGRVLALDNSVQLTELDEFSWQEMATYLPLNSHPYPKKVLVIGGGDGGTARDISKHPLVESVTMCEIDETVIEISKKYLPFMAKGFESPKLTLHIGDGVEFMKNHQNEFDVIITDSTDPKGPAVCLYERAYYENLKRALKPDGLLLSQGTTFWYDRPLVKELVKMCRTLFPVVDYGTSYVASFPAGHIGYICCSKNPETNFRIPVNRFSHRTLKELDLKYYTPDVHRAAFSLPLFVAQDLGLDWEVKSK